jgi:hypothetical protein
MLEPFSSISFRYILSNLYIKVEVGPYCGDQHQFFFKEEDAFSLDSIADSKNLVLAERHLYFRLFLENYLSFTAEKKIFSERVCSLYRDTKGFFQLLNYSKNKQHLQWKICIDPEFSIFEYQISPEAAKNTDFHNLIFNRFLLQHTFINHNGLIIHAAGGSIHGKGMIFPAVSGTGKSTLSHLLLPFSENQLYSEERIIMRKMNDGWHLWGTPWKGTGVIARNESAPLSALVFLSQAPQTTISELPPSSALRRLLETVSIPWYSQEWTDKGLAICESLLRDIPAFELAFRPDQTAVQAVADLAASLP